MQCLKILISMFKPKTFFTRILYNSNFKNVHKSQANKNIHKNVKHVDKTKCVQSDKSKVNHMLYTPKQRCNIVQDGCYNVPVMNRFEILNIDDNSQVDTCDNVDNYVQTSLQKQVHKVCINKSGFVTNRNSNCESLDTKKTKVSCVLMV